MISILLPTRKRPKKLERLVNSLRETSSVFPEIVVYIDDDDLESLVKAEELKLKIVKGPRLRCLSNAWNKCYDNCTGDILVTCGDDVVFRTQNWDKMMEEKFESYLDHIVMVYGQDIIDNVPTPSVSHPVIHRRCVEIAGYFSPPLFRGNDLWWRDVFVFLGRAINLPFVMDHMHHSVGKSEFDDTYREANQEDSNFMKTGEYSNFSEGLVKYADMAYERLEDAAKLQEVINQYERYHENDFNFISNA